MVIITRSDLIKEMLPTDSFMIGQVGLGQKGVSPGGVRHKENVILFILWYGGWVLKILFYISYFSSGILLNFLLFRWDDDEEKGANEMGTIWFQVTVTRFLVMLID